jgi:NitT/TauT family transport system permease protein
MAETMKTDGASIAINQKFQTPAPILSLVILVVILAIWETASAYGLINKYFLSAPSAIAMAGWKILLDGELFLNVAVTGYAYLVGVISACVLGAGLGLAMGWWRRFGDIVDPYVVFFSAMPRIALYPVFLMVFGIGDASRILIVFVGVLFPVLFNAYIGAKQTPKVLVDAGLVFGYSKNRLFFKIVLPASLPYLMAGFRIGVTLGMILVVVAEFFGSSNGLGQKIAVTAQLFQTPQMYAWVVYTSVIALFIVWATDWVERRVLRWV